jgi:hypothetical protein
MDAKTVSGTTSGQDIFKQTPKGHYTGTTQQIKGTDVKRSENYTALARNLL